MQELLQTWIFFFFFVMSSTLCRPPDSVVPTSCRNRCYSAFDDEVVGCRCDENCLHTNSCCSDFVDICKAPSETLFSASESFALSLQLCCCSALTVTVGSS